MSVSSTLAHAAIKDLYSAMDKVRAMMLQTDKIRWEIVKPIESLEALIDDKKDVLQEELGFE